MTAADSERLDGLLQAWEAGGRVVTPADLCRDCPHLLPELERRVAQLRSLDWLSGYRVGDRPTGRESDTGPVSGYRLLAEIGRGGFGKVYRATSPTGEMVAVKVIDVAGEVSGEWKAFDRLRECRHPHLLPVYGAWKTETGVVLAMQLAECSLLDRLRQCPKGLPPEELLAHVRGAAAGLDALHAAGLTHRDVKPSNLLLVGGVVKVADFGLAKPLDRSRVSHTGAVTLDYAAPEYLQGTTSREGDQYALAATYFHLRTGRPLFEGSPAQVMAAHLHKSPDLSLLPADERPAVRRALSKSPRDRWPSCAGFAESLMPRPAVPRRSRLLPLAAGVLLGAATGPLWMLAVPERAAEPAQLHRPDPPQAVGPAKSVTETPTKPAPVAPPNKPAAVWVTEAPPPRPVPPVDFAGRSVFHFDGKSRIVTPLERFAPVTLEAWVYPVAPRIGSQERFVLGSDIPERSGIGLAMRYAAWSKASGNWDFGHPPQVLVQVLPGTRVRNTSLPTGQTLPHDRWSHLAAVFGEDETVVYLDGRLVARGVVSGTAGGSRFAVGCAGVDNPAHHFTGKMRSIRVTRGERYAGEFVPMAEMEADRDTVLLYSADAVDGGKVTDLSGNRNDGMMEGVTVGR